jgi:UDP-N-acetylglucosamine 2-epimerase (non-hydrolysing)
MKTLPVDASQELKDIVFVHTGQNYDYELNEIFFHDLGVRKSGYFFDAAGGLVAETIGQTLIKIDPILAEERPEALLVLGDTIIVAFR